MNARLLVELTSRGLTDEGKFLKKHTEKICGVGIDGGRVEDAQMVLGMAKQGGVDFIGRHTRTAKKGEKNLPEPELFVKEEVGEAVAEAYGKMKVALGGAHERMIKMERRAVKDRGLVGKLSEEREDGLKQARAVFDNLKKTTEGLGECLGEEEVVLREIEKEEEKKGTGLSVATKQENNEGDLGPWEDADQKRYYEDVPDFLEKIPYALLRMTKEEVEEKKAEAKKWFGGEGDIGDEGGEEGNQDDDLNQEDGDEEEEGEEVGAENTSYKLTALLDEELINIRRKEECDKIAESFLVGWVSSKGARKR